MIDAATGARVAAWFTALQDSGEQHPGGFGDLTDAPGPDLAADLDLWDPATRSDEDLINRIGAWEKFTAWTQARQLAEIAELAELAGSLPPVHAALGAGTIDLIRARIIAENTRTLDLDHRVQVAAMVLPKAGTQTPSTLRAAVARAIAIIDPTGIEDRHHDDLTGRRVTVTPRENGMSELWAFLPADGAAAIMASLHRLAEGSHTPTDRASGDDRTADQRRADALVDLATSYLDAHPGLQPTPTSAPTSSGAPASTATHPTPAGRHAAGSTQPGPNKPSSTGANRTGPRDPASPNRATRRTRRPPAWAQVQVVLPTNLLTGHGPEPAKLLGYGPIPSSGSPATGAAASRAAANPASIWTTRSPIPTGPPPTTTSPACADTTTTSNNTPAGRPASTGPPA